MQRKSIHEPTRVQNTQSIKLVGPDGDITSDFPELIDLDLSDVLVLEVDGLPKMVDIAFAQDYAEVLVKVKKYQEG